MEEMTLGDLTSMCGGRLLKGEATEKARGISIDSRTVGKSQVFLALKGESFDGHDFSESALEKGAAAVIGKPERLKPLAGKVNQHTGLIEVDEPLSALHRLASTYRQKFDIPVIVITGSCGKTTTKDMLAAILGRSRKTIATEGNLNNLIGAPLMLLRIDSNTAAAVFEIASNAPGEIDQLARMLKPTAGMLTNIGPVHLEGLKTIDGVFEEKTCIIPHIRSDGFLIINEDDIPLDRIRSRFGGRIITFGRRKSADFYATDIRQDVENGTEFLLNNKERLRIPILGEHNVLNALAATAAARHLGDNIDSVRQGLEHFSASAMRMEVYKHRGVTIVNDAYNANPRAMRESISTVVALPAERRIFVFGDMLELGEHSHEEHFSLGQYIGRNKPGLLYLLGNFSGGVSDGARDAGMQLDRIHCGDDAGEIAESLKRILRPGDLLLIKGSRGMHMEKIVQRIIEED